MARNYRQISYITRTKFQNLNVFRLVLQLSLPSPLKPGVKSGMKMKLEQRQEAMLQLHLSDQQVLPYDRIYLALILKYACFIVVRIKSS